jgi:pimeloyl-ACP methyl ester carboxylesterase
MKKLCLRLICLLAGLFLTHCKNNDAMPKNTYLLVHGAWHGAWAWKYITPLLEAQGHKVVAIDLPGHGTDKTPVANIGLSDYTKKIVEVATAQTGQVILVGHSMGGIPISQAAETLGTSKVSKLVYIDAFMPKNSESVQSLAALALPKNPPFEAAFVIEDMGKTVSLNPSLLKNSLYHDCSQTDIDFAVVNLSKEPLAVLGTPVQVSDGVYGKIPKYYILCTQSRDSDKSPLTTRVPTEKIYKLDSSHSPFFSMPDKLAAILLEL